MSGSVTSTSGTGSATAIMSAAQDEAYGIGIEGAQERAALIVKGAEQNKDLTVAQTAQAIAQGLSSKT